MRHVHSYALLFFIPSLALAQSNSVTLTLAEALNIAAGKSEQVQIAEAGVRRATAEVRRARSQFLPQLNSFAGYTRTLASEFNAIFGSSQQQQPACPPLAANPMAPVSERVAELERFLLCGGPSTSPFGGGNLGSLPFGRTNVWNLGLNFAQAAYAGGRLRAQSRLAEAGREIARIQVDSTNAQFLLDVTQSFYDTALAHRLLQIAEANLAEAERTLEFTELGFKVGRLPEFDVLRAAVTRRNQQPEIARRRAALQQSGMRLRQLLDIPMGTNLTIADELSATDLPIPQPFADRFNAIIDPVQTAGSRAPVRQAASVVRQREASADIARGQRLPTVSLGSDYGLVAYPSGFLPTSTNQFRNNWTLGFNVSLPLFTGGRIRAEIEAAEATVDEARAQRQLTHELAVLDSSVALNQLQTAREEWEASSGTVDQATRALEIARLRYSQGISNQLELDNARVAVLQARANRAQAARDLQVMRATIALLPLLPLSGVQQAPGQPTAPIRNQQQAQPGVFQQQQPANVLQTPAGGASSLQQGGGAAGGAVGAGRRF